MSGSCRVKSFLLVNIFIQHSVAAFVPAPVQPLLLRPIAATRTMVSTRSVAATKRLVGTGSSQADKESSIPKKIKLTKKKAAVKQAPTKKAPTKKSPAQNTSKTTSIPNQGNTTNPTKNALICLAEIDELIPVTMVKRPSRRNRSPYVADVLVATAKKDTTREAICHVPNLDMGGKCIPSSDMLVKPARDRKGVLVGPDAVSPKYGTPKCEYIAQLLRVDETSLGYTPAVWVGAHPSLGEKIAEQLLQRNCLHPHLPKIQSIQREVRNIGGADMRADFLLHFEQDGKSKKKHKPCVLEVKTVVDTDFAADRVPTERTKCVFVSDKAPYRRAGIFPWGQSNQKGPDGEKVVSARAIKHVRELTRLTKGELKGADGEIYQTAVLFVVIRKDAEYFRPNHEACPSFCKYLKEAKDAGVQVFAKRVDWGDTKKTLGQCLEGPLLDIEWPKLGK